MQKRLLFVTGLFSMVLPLLTTHAALVVATDQVSWEDGTPSTLVTDFEGLAPSDQPSGGNFTSSNSFVGNGATITPLNANGFVFSVVDRDYMGSDYFEPEATQNTDTGFTIAFDAPTVGFAFDFSNFGLSPMLVTITIGSESVSLFNTYGQKGFFGVTSDVAFTSATVQAVEADGDGNPVLDENGDQIAAGYPSYDNIRVSPIPEPGTFAMVFGIVAGGWIWSRRKMLSVLG